MPQSKIALSFLFMFIFVVGLAIGFFLFKTLNEGDIINPQRTENKRYLSTELILSGTDKDKNTFFVHLLLNRKQTSLGGFTHYYTQESIAKQKFYQLSVNTENTSDALLSNGLVSNLKVIPAEDLSTRESYTFTLTLDGTNYEVKTTLFEGDFIIKNSIDYTRYVSIGKAIVSSKDSSITVNALLLNSYAENYSKYVFFEGYDQLDSTTHLLAFWDSSDNFYFVDQSQTLSLQENYKSHTWVLYKNKAGEMKKSFSANITHPKVEKNPLKWSVSLPEINDAQVDLEVDYYSEKRAAGTVLGEIKTASGTRPIHGYAIYAEY